MVRRHIGSVALYQYQGLPSEEDEVQMNHELIHDLLITLMMKYYKTQLQNA